MSDVAPGFTAGFAARHAAAAHLLQAAFSPPAGFAARDPRERAYGRRASDQPTGPRHFSPAESWNPDEEHRHPEPFSDPIAAAREEGYAAGMAAAAEAARDDATRNEALLADLTAALRQGAGFDRDAMARHLRQTVLFLVGKIVGETGVTPDLLAERIESATEMLADSAESALLRVHPDDVPLLEGKLPKTVFAAGDPVLKRGSFVLESASTVVEDGPDHWLEQLAAAIDRIPVPPLC
jgi:flagellar assembly protein FliH